MEQLELANILANFANHTGTMNPQSTWESFLPEDWFLCELRKTLQNEWNHRVVSWLPEGKIWRVHDLAAFQTVVLCQFPVIRDYGNPLDLFLAYARVKGFEEVSRGLNSIAFYHQVCLNCDQLNL